MVRDVTKLKKAKIEKKDEFYTQLSDIEKELEHYVSHFKGKIVYSNCDNHGSNFVKYFNENFDRLQLKDYWYTPDNFKHDTTVEFLKKADIVVTNPPFSIFRKYFSLLTEHKKDFLVIASMTALTNKVIFPYIQEGKIWVGRTPKVAGMDFIVPESYAEEGVKQGVSIIKYKSGKYGLSVSKALWLTNLENGREERRIELKETYDPKKYKKYDNYDAIEVSGVSKIPKDYPGIMGVPVSFLPRHNPNQFEILGCTQRGCHDLVPDTRKYDDYWEVKQDGKKTGSSGKKTNENPVIKGDNKRTNYFTNGERTVHSLYSRVFIRNKEL